MCIRDSISPGLPFPGNGKPGEITRFLQNKFTEIVRGNNEEFNEWIYPVYQ